MLDDLKIVSIREHDDEIQLVFEYKGLYSIGVYSKDITINDIIADVKETIENALEEVNSLTDNERSTEDILLKLDELITDVKSSNKKLDKFNKIMNMLDNVDNYIER